MEPAEVDAKAAITSLKAAGHIRSTKADWRLVAAAQAMRRGSFSDEFDAANAMGKTIAQRREVSNWSAKLALLEQSEQPRRSSRLLVQRDWIQRHLPGVQMLEPPSPVPTEKGQHAKRSLAAVVSTPGGSMQQLESEVSYTLPPAHGESGSAAKRRNDRHREREETALRKFDVSGVAVAESRAKVARSMAAARERHIAERDGQLEVRAILRSIITQVEQRNGWLEDRSFHWLPLSPLQLVDWPSRLGYTHGKFGMPMRQGDHAWLVDPQNAHPPRLASVSRWFSNGHVELRLMDEAGCRLSAERRVVQPEPGVVLALDERRPRYVGEHVLLWAKQSCAALRGSDSDVEAHAASATTCPDYRPLGSGCEFKAAYLINEEMYEFEGLGYEGGYGGYGENHICSNSLERADSVLEGRSNLAVVTAVHPTDRFVVSSTTWRAPRKFFVQARSEETGAHFRLGKAKVTESVKWVIGSVDLVLFDACTATFTGPALERVPLFLVNGAGQSASLLQAKLVAQAELFRLFADDLHSERMSAVLDGLASAPSPEQLESQLCEWPSTIGMEVCDDVIEHLLGLQEAALREQALQDLVAAFFTHQHGGVSLEDLSGQGRFPDKLPEEGVSGKSRVVQDYDPDPHPMHHVSERKRNESGVLRTDYLLW